MSRFPEAIVQAGAVVVVYAVVFQLRALALAGAAIVAIGMAGVVATGGGAA